MDILLGTRDILEEAKSLAFLKWTKIMQLIFVLQVYNLKGKFIINSYVYIAVIF